MTAHSKHRGHPIWWDGSLWRYQDKDAGECEIERPCGHCELPNRDDKHDACLGCLSGVMNACCGHGETREAYVQFGPRVTLRGRAARVAQWALRKVSES